MEVLLTIWSSRPLTTDQWTLWPPTPVVLATLSMEPVQGLVRLMECGVDQHQRVKVGDSVLLLTTVLSMHAIFILQPLSVLLYRPLPMA